MSFCMRDWLVKDPEGLKSWPDGGVWSGHVISQVLVDAWCPLHSEPKGVSLYSPRIYRWQYTQYTERYLQIILPSINIVAPVSTNHCLCGITHQYNNSYTHLFLCLRQVEGFYGNQGRLHAILYICFQGGSAAWFLSLAWRVQLLIVASLPELLECEWGSPPFLNACWIMPFKAKFELRPCLILSVSLMTGYCHTSGTLWMAKGFCRTEHFELNGSIHTFMSTMGGRSCF